MDFELDPGIPALDWTRWTLDESKIGSCRDIGRVVVGRNVLMGNEAACNIAFPTSTDLRRLQGEQPREPRNRRNTFLWATCKRVPFSALDLCGRSYAELA